MTYFDMIVHIKEHKWGTSKIQKTETEFLNHINRVHLYQINCKN